MRKFSLIMPSRNFKEYEVWNDSRSLAKEVYELTKDFPYAERKGLVDQLHRAVVSIPSNIAEGSSRSNSDFARFLEIALGSAYEVQTQLILSYDLGLITEQQLSIIEKKIETIEKQLSNFILFLRKQ